MAKNLDMVYLIDTYAAALTDKQREVLEFYYYDDLSLAEIAQNSGITRQGVRDSIKRGETAIIELEERLGFAKKMRGIRNNMQRIHKNAQEIIVINDTFTYSNEIKRAAAEILSALEQTEND
ncbi:MAG: sigma factor-like helix-turn-helix DNA-binding protein [Oscillospiraceae bacterium]